MARGATEYEHTTRASVSMFTTVHSGCLAYLLDWSCLGLGKTEFQKVCAKSINGDHRGMKAS